MLTFINICRIKQQVHFDCFFSFTAVPQLSPAVSQLWDSWVTAVIAGDNWRQLVTAGGQLGDVGCSFLFVSLEGATPHSRPLKYATFTGAVVGVQAVPGGAGAAVAELQVVAFMRAASV